MVHPETSIFSLVNTVRDSTRLRFKSFWRGETTDRSENFDESLDIRAAEAPFKEGKLAGCHCKHLGFLGPVWGLPFTTR